MGGRLAASICCREHVPPATGQSWLSSPREGSAGRQLQGAAQAGRPWIRPTWLSPRCGPPQAPPGRAVWPGTLCTLVTLSARRPGFAHGPDTRRGAGRRRHTQLDAINKTFIQTTAVQGTIQIKKKKKRRKETKNIFSTLHLHTSFAVLCLHSSIEHGILWI